MRHKGKKSHPLTVGGKYSLIKFFCINLVSPPEFFRGPSPPTIKISSSISMMKNIDASFVFSKSVKHHTNKQMDTCPNHDGDTLCFEHRETGKRVCGRCIVAASGDFSEYDMVRNKPEHQDVPPKKSCLFHKTSPLSHIHKNSQQLVCSKCVSTSGNRTAFVSVSEQELGDHIAKEVLRVTKEVEKIEHWRKQYSQRYEKYLKKIPELIQQVSELSSTIFAYLFSQEHHWQFCIVDFHNFWQHTFNNGEHEIELSPCEDVSEHRNLMQSQNESVLRVVLKTIDWCDASNLKILRLAKKNHRKSNPKISKKRGDW